jgi:serine/threonine-protein kinase
LTPVVSPGEDPKRPELDRLLEAAAFGRPKIVVQSDPWHAVSVREGEILGGKYQIERVLGVGGMGLVAAARHLQLDTRVALKFLLPALSENREAVQRFAREARAAVKITSEHVVRVLDVGTLEGGAPFMVMEFLDGGDLAGWLAERGPLPIEQTVDFVLQTCIALADAHGLGIVHRDLKPSNLFCVRRSDGQYIIKVLDFGISRLTDPDVSMTSSTAVLGSPVYMSPEQMQSAKDADAQSDIWALGVIMYELLSGRVPFDGNSATEIAVKVATQLPPSLCSLRADVPAELEAVVFKCLAKDRPHRYRSVAELAGALADFAPKRARSYVDRIAKTRKAPASSATVTDVAKVPPAKPVALWISVASVLVVAAAAVSSRYTRAAAPREQPAAGLTGPTPAPPVDPAPSTAALAPPPPTTAETANAPEPRATAPRRTLLVPARPSALPSSPTRAPAPNCDPPFTLDDQGRKHFKAECYLKSP